MAGELLQAVTSGGAFDLKTLTDTFAAVADRNLKARELDLREKEAAQNSVLKAAGMDLREQALALRTNQSAAAAQGQELLNNLRMQKLQEAQLGLQQAREYNDAVAGAAKDGKSLTVRMKSDDPTEAEDAYRTFSAIRDKFRGSLSPIVNNDLKAMESLPVVQAKAALAQKAEERRVQDLERKQEQGGRRLDLGENILDETTRHHKATEQQGDTRLDIGQQNADTRRQNSDARIEGKGGVMGITLPNLGHVSMDKIRGVLARGMASDATHQEVSDADVLRKSILAVPSGNKNPDTGAMIPRFSNDDIVKWSAEGAAAPVRPKAAPAAPSTAAADPTPAPAGQTQDKPSKSVAVDPAPLGRWRPGFEGKQMGHPSIENGFLKVDGLAPGTVVNDPVTGGDFTVPPLPAPSGEPSPDAPAPSATPASELLKKYKIPARPKTSAADVDPATPDSLYGATQNYLTSLGIVPAPTPIVGFGGFGLPAA